VRKRLAGCRSKAELMAYHRLYDTMPWLEARHRAMSDQDIPERAAAERLDASQLGQVVRAHRGDRSMRQAAAEAGVSLSTMSRVESGSLPDLASFTALCAWAGVSPSRFFTPIAERQDTHVEIAIAHLSADPRLSHEQASSIASVIRQMYDALAAKAEPAAPLAACHLRAASTLRPGVPERLGGIIVDLHEALERRIATGGNR
jgi:transcriptional regulator with XRE-family HTH domain